MAELNDGDFIATCEREMRETRPTWGGDSYWTNDAKQAQYRDAISRRDAQSQQRAPSASNAELEDLKRLMSNPKEYWAPENEGKRERYLELLRGNETTKESAQEPTKERTSVREDVDHIARALGTDRKQTWDAYKSCLSIEGAAEDPNALAASFSNDLGGEAKSYALTMLSNPKSFVQLAQSMAANAPDAYVELEMWLMEQKRSNPAVYKQIQKSLNFYDD